MQDKANWRAKHENLIATLKAARGQGPAVAPVVDPGYVECPYCNRNFNEHAAERHIPFCKEQSARMPKTSVNKKSSLNKRTQVRKFYFLFLVTEFDYFMRILEGTLSFSNQRRFRQWWFFKNNSGREAKGLNFPNILGETRVLDKYLEYVSITRVFHEKWCTRKSKLKQKSDFRLKYRVFGLWFYYFCREFTYSISPRVGLCPICPPSSRCWVQFLKFSVLKH